MIRWKIMPVLSIAVGKISYKNHKNHEKMRPSNHGLRWDKFGFIINIRPPLVHLQRFSSTQNFHGFLRLWGHMPPPPMVNRVKQ